MFDILWIVMILLVVLVLISMYSLDKNGDAGLRESLREGNSRVYERKDGGGIEIM